MRHPWLCAPGLVFGLVFIGACHAQDRPMGAMTTGATMQASRVETPSQIVGSTGYPRIVRVIDAAGNDTGKLVASSLKNIFESSDHGHKWQLISTIDPTADGLTMRCCETLFQLTRPVGNLPRGTLVYAASYLKGGVPALGYYLSSDHGKTWIFQGTPVVRGSANHHGLWEPQFEIANDGALVMFWSDETDPAHSQKLSQMRNYFRGKGWQDEKDTVASNVQSDRPGMAVVNQLSNGHFFMTYEVQGPTHKGAVHARISLDGWDFGDPADLGFRPTDEQGEYFKVAPSNVWVRTGEPHGTLFVVGRNLVQQDGRPAALDGQVLFMNNDPDGRGVWRRIPAPVPVPRLSAHVINCENYSSALLAYPDGKGIVELATKADNPNATFGPGCSVYVGHMNLARVGIH